MYMDMNMIWYDDMIWWYDTINDIVKFYIQSIVLITILYQKKKVLITIPFELSVVLANSNYLFCSFFL